MAGVLGALIVRRGIEGDLALALGLFTAGSFVAGIVAGALVRRIGSRLEPRARLAFAVLALMLLTSAAQHIAYFIHYVWYYSGWWGEPLSPGWLEAFVTAYAGSGFYFIALGLPLMLPVGIPVIFAAAIFLARTGTDSR
ncbi:MAG: hypothetical protein AB7O56_15540 [Bauldia sp.]